MDLCKQTILGVQGETARAWRADEDAEKRVTLCQAVLDKEMAGINQRIASTEGDIAGLRLSLSARLQPLINTGAVQVEVRNGHMVVKLPSSVLFESGAAELDEGGQTTLAQVSSALRDVGPYDLVVTGHTDSVPIHTAKFDDNWDLSAARAAEVVRFLVDHGLDAKHLMAAGVGEYDPIADDSTDAGREQNRRIEIVLIPRIESVLGTDSSEPTQPTSPPVVPGPQLRPLPAGSDEPTP